MEHPAPRPMDDELSANPPRTWAFCLTLLDPSAGLRSGGMLAAVIVDHPPRTAAHRPPGE
jgi:hypothetical protein